MIGIVSICKNDKKYACFAQSFIDGNWYLYNDERVLEIKLENILDIHNSFEFIPCILIYEDLNNEQNTNL